MQAHASILRAMALFPLYLVLLVLLVAGAVLIVAAATAYFAVAGEITRAVLLPIPAPRTVPARSAVSQPPSPPRRSANLNGQNDCEN